ncbi:MAG: tetratricopeptide repeat protein [Planctomycetota bacterium]
MIRVHFLLLTLALASTISIAASQTPTPPARGRRPAPRGGIAALPVPELGAELTAQAAAALAASDDPRAAADDLWNACIIAHGTIEPLVAELVARIDADATPPRERLAARRLATRILRRLGALPRAHQIIQRIPESERSPADLQELLAIVDALGQYPETLLTIERLLALPSDPKLTNRLLLRRALLTKRDAQDTPSPLATFASAPERDATTRKQAAMILALTGEEAEAVRLYEIAGEPVEQYHDHVRVAEWAIEAKLWPAAQEHAWSALRGARLARDRRYALTLLAEAYRQPRALRELSARFAAEPELAPEARHVWIDVLRETGAIEEALRLFRTESEGRFTIEMRRELLEMCRESGRDAILLDAYAHAIADEPRAIEWREGLSRYYLERGDRTAALEVWRPYVTITNDTRYLLAAATALATLGLDELAEEFARCCPTIEPATADAVRLFVFQLHFDRGRLERARETLDELDARAAPEDPVRADLAESYVRLGDPKRAIAVLKALAAARGDERGVDLEMKLAHLYSQIGAEERALECWRDLWPRVDSIPQRRFVEDRLMTLAAQLGQLAAIAVELERRLIAGQASDREAGLLVRIYSHAKDPVSAAEIIEEHMRQKGGNEVDALNEKARVFLACQDYFHYEETMRALIDIDADGASDYLRQLAMSNLERGQREEARQVLVRLAASEKDSLSDEFEAGVLAIAGLREESARAYARGLARRPERIDNYLLLANVLREIGQHEAAAGMFQYLAETAERDDLFTIAIDGILNLRDGRGNRGAPDSLIAWARRITLERIATRPDKLYLYQLAADLAAELRDTNGAVRALKAGLPIAGEQRSSQLRELMALTDNAALKRMFGRRLLGQGELVPPQVYLDLGATFLAAGDVTNAARTFQQASRLPEFAELQRRIAAEFERAQYPQQALHVYERVLTVESTDAALLSKVGELHEQLGNDAAALQVYLRGIDLLLARQPVVVGVAVEADTKPTAALTPTQFGAGNVGAFESHFPWLLRGLLATLPTDSSALAVFERQLANFHDDLERVRRTGVGPDAQLAAHPRLAERARLCRRLAIAVGQTARLSAIDDPLLETFTADTKLLAELCRFRVDWGLLVSARHLVDTAARPDAEKQPLRLLTGAAAGDQLPGTATIAEARAQVLTLLVDGREQAARLLLERVDVAGAGADDLEAIPLLVAGAAYLNASDLALTLCRHWIQLVVRNTKEDEVYTAVESVLNGSRRVLEPEQLRSLMEDLVSGIVATPQKFAQFLNRLSELRPILGDSFLTANQIETLIRSRLAASDQMVYGIPDLIQLAAADDRPELFRSAWPRIAKTQRASFVLMLIPKLDAPVASEFADALLASFEEALSDLENHELLAYQVDELVSAGDANLELVRRILETLLAREAQNVHTLAAHALLLKKLGRDDDALAAALAAFASLTSVPGTSYRLLQARRNLLTAFYEQHAAAFLSVLVAEEEKSGTSVELSLQRLDLAERQKDDSRFETEIERALDLHPRDAKVLARARAWYASRGDRMASLGLLERMIALDSTSVPLRSQLVSFWEALRHPLRALDVLTKKTDEETSFDTEGATVERTPPATMELVAQQVADNDLAARANYRRAWRLFPDRNEQYFAWRYEHEIRERRFWPRDEGQSRAHRERGGFPAIFDRAPGVKDDSDAVTDEGHADGTTNPDDDDARAAQSAIVAAVNWGADEVRRELRSLDLEGLAAPLASDIFAALADDARQQSADGADGAARAVAELLAKDRAGEAGKIEYGRLFALFEAATLAATSEVAATLPGLLKSIDAHDLAQITRLARLAARLGDAKRAALLYSWCALVGGLETRFDDFANATRLLKEVVKELTGAEREQVVATVLRFADPGLNALWGRDGYERLVLDTWDELGGPGVALERGRAICASIVGELGDLPRRETAIKVAELHARAGELEPAIAALEVALTKLTPPARGLRYAFFRTYFDAPAQTPRAELGRLFPPRGEGFQDASAWLVRVAAALDAWDAARRLDPIQGFEARSLVAARLAELGQHERARNILSALEPFARGHANRELWLADLTRRVGDNAAADALELRQFAERRLHSGRIPVLIERVRAAEGEVAALALAEPATEWTLDEELMEQIIAMNETLGRTERAAEWRATLTRAIAAEPQIAKAIEKLKPPRP